MWKTTLLLLITIIVIPFFAFRVDEPLSAYQRAILVHLILVYLSTALLCFILSLLSGNYSQVDKLWSLIPIAYVWIVAIRAEFEPRILLMAVLVTIWLNWSIMGAILLVLLFFGSSSFSESVSAEKYEDYETYRERVPRFIGISSFRSRERE